MDSLSADRMESQTQLPQSQQPAASHKGTTFLRTCFNGLNSLSGVGILSVPYALSQGGWLSLIIFFVVATVCWYTALLLRRCMDSNQLLKSYPDIGELAFGYRGRALISIFMYVELYLILVEFLIFEGDNLDKLFPNMRIELGSLKIGGRQGFVLLTALIVLPTTWLRNLGMLAYVSAGGVLACVVLVGCVFWVGAVDGVGFHYHSRDMLVNWSGLPTAISLFAFCFCSHAVFPTLHDSMGDRSKFSKVLAICFVAIAINDGLIAVLGYLMFGPHLKSQITLNLPIGNISTKIAIYIILISPLSKYALVMTPVATAIEEKIPIRKSRTISILVRTGLVIGTVIVALTIPFFGYIMAFIGSFFSITVSMLLPCLCYLKIERSSRKFGVELVVMVAILVAGSFVGALGTYTSVKQIVQHVF